MSRLSTMMQSDRRSFLKALGAVGAFTIVGSPAIGARPTTAWAMQGGGDTVLVTVFLRGGADGLGIVVPHGDDAYYTHRPVMGRPLAELDDLDGFFGLDPTFSALTPEFTEGRLAFVHAVAAPVMSRSHFEAQPMIDRALAGTGWLQRALFAGSFPAQSSGLSIGPRVSPPLAGPWSGSVVASLDQSNESGAVLTELRTSIEDLYADAPFAMDRDAALAALVSVDQLAAVVPTTGEYPETTAGFKMREAASLIKANIGVRGVGIDLGGWDTHRDQRDSLDILGPALSEALVAFQADLGSDAPRVVTVLLTEFGRTARENSSLGTDHGRAMTMAVLGESVAEHGGGQVHLNGAWPSLDLLDQGGLFGGLRATTDFRDVLSELVSEHLGVADVASVFPGHVPAPLGLVSSQGLIGDVDQSGMVDQSDVSMILDELVGNTDPGYDADAGDLDADNDTDLRDALLLAKETGG